MKGNAVFAAAIITEIIVFSAFYYEVMAYLWLNVLGCIMVIIISLLIQLVYDKEESVLNRNDI